MQRAPLPGPGAGHDVLHAGRSAASRGTTLTVASTAVLTSLCNQPLRNRRWHAGTAPRGALPNGVRAAGTARSLGPLQHPQHLHPVPRPATPDRRSSWSAAGSSSCGWPDFRKRWATTKLPRSALQPPKREQRRAHLEQVPCPPGGFRHSTAKYSGSRIATSSHRRPWHWPCRQVIGIRRLRNSDVALLGLRQSLGLQIAFAARKLVGHVEKQVGDRAKRARSTGPSNAIRAQRSVPFAATKGSGTASPPGPMRRTWNVAVCR